MIRFLLAAVLVVVSASTLRAQRIAPAFASSSLVSESSLVAPEASRAHRASSRLGHVARGAAIGAGIGAVTGATLGYAFADTDDTDDGCRDFCIGVSWSREEQALALGLTGAATGAVIGGVVGFLTHRNDAPVAVSRTRDGGTAFAVRVAF